MTDNKEQEAEEVRVHFDGPNVTEEAISDPATQAALKKMEGLLRAKELIRTGNAAVMPDGKVVDARQHPESVPIPPHSASPQIPKRNE